MANKLPKPLSIMYDSTGKCHSAEVNWITNHVLKVVPNWYQKHLNIVSLGAGTGATDYILAKHLTDRGCVIDSYILVDPGKFDTIYDEYIPANKVKRLQAPMQNVKLTSPITLSLYLNSLHHDTNMASLNMFSAGPYGAALTFISCNSKHQWYTAPQRGALKLLQTQFDKLSNAIKFTQESIPAAFDVTDNPELFSQLIQGYEAESKNAPEIISTDEIANVRNEYSRKKAAKESPIVMDFAKVYKSEGAIISKAEKKPVYDNFMVWQKSGFGPGYDEQPSTPSKPSTLSFTSTPINESTTGNTVAFGSIQDSISVIAVSAVVAAVGIALFAYFARK